MDFSPIEQTISLHGLGFIQVKLPNNKRLHVWYPGLPSRIDAEYLAVHNHRFSFSSCILKGVQINQRFDVTPNDGGDFRRVSHDGPRSVVGGRESRMAERVDIRGQKLETYTAGETYCMDELEYHQTSSSGPVITLMTKLTEGGIHASSIITRDSEFEQSFNRFQLSEAVLWTFVRKAFED